ncbi:MAG: hypothetical protein WBA16_05595 [Nonlabens sp.]
MTIVLDNTTYKDLEVIEELKQYLLSVQYYPDSKLKNNFYDSTFEFINSKFNGDALQQPDSNLCKRFKKGKYRYAHVLYKETKIKRKRRLQKEFNSDERQIYKIKWNSNYHYTLTYKRMSDPRLQHLIGETIDVEILGLLENDSYLY